MRVVFILFVGFVVFFLAQEKAHAQLVADTTKDKGILPQLSCRFPDVGNAFSMVRGDDSYILVLDSAGHLVVSFLNPIGTDFNHKISEGLFVAFDTLAMRFGYMDLKGNWVIAAKFWRVEDFKDGVAAVWEDPDQHPDTGSGCGTPVLHAKWGYIDKKGEYIIPAEHGEPGERVNGNIVFFLSGGVVHTYDTKGNRVNQ